MSGSPVSAAGRAEVEAARVLLARLGISAGDLLQAAPSLRSTPTFADYVPVVSAAVSAGTRRVYGTYWDRIVQQWGPRRLDEPTASEIQQLAEYVRAHVVARRNAPPRSTWPRRPTNCLADCSRYSGWRSGTTTPPVWRPIGSP